jgi:hypothetical protein
MASGAAPNSIRSNAELVAALLVDHTGDLTI